MELRKLSKIEKRVAIVVSLFFLFSLYLIYHPQELSFWVQGSGTIYEPKNYEPENFSKETSRVVGVLICLASSIILFKLLFRRKI